MNIPAAPADELVRVFVVKAVPCCFAARLLAGVLVAVVANLFTW